MGASNCITDDFRISEITCENEFAHLYSSLAEHLHGRDCFVYPDAIQLPKILKDVIEKFRLIFRDPEESNGETSVSYRFRWKGADKKGDIVCEILSDRRLVFELSTTGKIVQVGKGFHGIPSVVYEKFTQ